MSTIQNGWKVPVNGASNVAEYQPIHIPRFSKDAAYSGSTISSANPKWNKRRDVYCGGLAQIAHVDWRRELELVGKTSTT